MQEILGKQIEDKLLEFSFYGKKYKTRFNPGFYSNGRLAIQLLCTEGKDSGQPFGVLTINIPEVELNNKEVIIKTWGENEEVTKAAINSGYFKDTGKRIATGFVQAQIWEVIINNNKEK